MFSHSCEAINDVTLSAQYFSKGANQGNVISFYVCSYQ